MALTLKSPETDRLAREVAAFTGESLTVAVHRALVERLQGEQVRRGHASDLAARLSETGAHCAALPDLTLRRPDRPLPALQRRRFASTPTPPSS